MMPTITLLDLPPLKDVLVDTTPDGNHAVVLGVRYVFEPMSFVAWLCGHYWWVLALLALGLALWAVWRVRRARAKGVVVGVAHCVRCRYPREGQTAARCPECGSERRPRVIRNRIALWVRFAWVPTVVALPVVAGGALAITGWPFSWRSMPIERGLWYDRRADARGAYDPILYMRHNRTLIELHVVEADSGHSRRVFRAYGRPRWGSFDQQNTPFVDTRGYAAIIDNRVVAWVDPISGERMEQTALVDLGKWHRVRLTPDRATVFEDWLEGSERRVRFTDVVTGVATRPSTIRTTDQRDPVRAAAEGDDGAVRSRLVPVRLGDDYAVLEPPSLMAMFHQRGNPDVALRTYLHTADNAGGDDGIKTFESTSLDADFVLHALIDPLVVGHFVFMGEWSSDYARSVVGGWDVWNDAALGQLPYDPDISMQRSLSIDASERFLGVGAIRIIERDGVLEVARSTGIRVRDITRREFVREAWVDGEERIQDIALGRDAQWALLLTKKSDDPEGRPVFRLIRWDDE